MSGAVDSNPPFGLVVEETWRGTWGDEDGLSEVDDAIEHVWNFQNCSDTMKIENSSIFIALLKDVGLYLKAYSWLLQDTQKESLCLI